METRISFLDIRFFLTCLEYIFYSAGPATWDKEFPIANTGERQSPIDLKAGEVKQDSNLNPMVASYAPFSDAKVLNNGHSVVFQPDAGQAGREPGNKIITKACTCTCMTNEKQGGFVLFVHQNNEI